MAAARLQLVFILRLPEGPRATELATIKQQNSRKKSVKTKNTKSKKKTILKYEKCKRNYGLNRTTVQPYEIIQA